jgi:hypothetical protein
MPASVAALILRLSRPVHSFFGEVKMLEVCLPGKFEVKLSNERVEIRSRPAQSLLACLRCVCFVSLSSVDDPQLLVSQIADAVKFSFQVRDPQAQRAPESQSNQLLAYLYGKHMLLVLDNLDHLLTPGI